MACVHGLQSTLVQRCYMFDVPLLSRSGSSALFTVLLSSDPIISQALAPFFEVDTRCRYCWHDPRPRAAPKRRAQRPSRSVCTMFLPVRRQRRILSAYRRWLRAHLRFFCRFYRHLRYLIPGILPSILRLAQMALLQLDHGVRMPHGISW